MQYILSTAFYIILSICIIYYRIDIYLYINGLYGDCRVVVIVYLNQLTPTFEHVVIETRIRFITSFLNPYR